MKLQDKIIVVLGEGPLFSFCVKELLKKFKNIYCLTNINNKLKYTKKINFTKIKRLKKIDYLFSIMNKKIINHQILSKTSNAINFHDAPLPRYAGLYSSTFGILNNEKIWGCTWHLMNKKLDQGDILFQKKFKISPDNTAYDVDVQSQFYGHVLFQKIIKNLHKINKYKKKQNLKKFTYFGKKEFNLIPNKGYIKMSNNFKEIYKIYRALKLSKEKTNLLFSPKIKIKNKTFFLKGMTILNNMRRKKKNTNILKILKSKNKNLIIKNKSNYYEFLLSKHLI